MERPEAARRALRRRRAEPARVPARTGRRARRLRGRGASGSSSSSSRERIVVGHSYGGVIALLAAARRPELVRSLTVIEPPAFGSRAAWPASTRTSRGCPRSGRAGRDEPEAFLRGFLAPSARPPARQLHAGAAAGRADAAGRAPAARGGDPARDAGGRAVPEARRLGRPRARRSRRCATCSRSGRRRASGPAGRRPLRAAPRRAVQRAARRLRPSRRFQVTVCYLDVGGLAQRIVGLAPPLDRVPSFTISST